MLIARYPLELGAGRVLPVGSVVPRELVADYSVRKALLDLGRIEEIPDAAEVDALASAEAEVTPEMVSAHHEAKRNKKRR